jgi:hypothetical protein
VEAAMWKGKYVFDVPFDCLADFVRKQEEEVSMAWEPIAVV